MGQGTCTLLLGQSSCPRCQGVRCVMVGPGNDPLVGPGNDPLVGPGNDPLEGPGNDPLEEFQNNNPEGCRGKRIINRTQKTP